MSSRQPKDSNSQRVHVSVPRRFLRVIDQAARKLNLSRSNYFVTVAKAAADVEMAEEAVARRTRHAKHA